jgi:hypothetical protein
MPLDFQTVQIDFLGLQQKPDPRRLSAGQLVIADNVEMDKAGRLARRRGYKRLHTHNAFNNSVQNSGNMLFHRLAVHQGKMVVLAHRKIYAVGSFPFNTFQITSVTTAALVDHGPISRTGIRVHVVATADRSLRPTPAGRVD